MQYQAMTAPVACSAIHPKETCGEEVAIRARHLQGRAVELTEVMNRKLHPVMRDNTAARDEMLMKATATPRRDNMPPRYAEIHDALDVIENCLDSYQEMLNRTEA